jgi:CMP/dCMP kinase
VKNIVIIAIGGPHGSGKSFIAEQIAEEFNMKIISAGKIFRNIAKERGLTLKELSKIAKEETAIDLEIDKRTQELGKIDNTLIDAQLAAHFTPNNKNDLKLDIIKICITASPNIRWNRIAKRENITEEEAKLETEIREKTESERFKELYNIDIDDLSPFDIVINTDRMSKEYVLELTKSIINFVKTK